MQPFAIKTVTFRNKNLNLLDEMRQKILNKTSKLPFNMMK